MPSVTIGMPVYNGEKFLDLALSCLSAQTYLDLEIVISDNASTDLTPEIVKKWARKDTRIRYYRQKETISILDNFLYVINNAKGKWFCYAAHDDKWSPNYIEELVQPLKKVEHAVISVPHKILIDKDGKKKSERFFRPGNEGASLKDIVKNNFSTVHSAWYYALYDRKALIDLQNSLVYFNEHWGRDFATFLPLLFSVNVVGSDKAIFYQRDTGISDQLYRPVKASDQYRHYRDLWKELLYYMSKSDLSLYDKISLTPVWYRYVRNVVKPRRILKTYLKEIISKITSIFKQT